MEENLVVCTIINNQCGKTVYILEIIFKKQEFSVYYYIISMVGPPNVCI